MDEIDVSANDTKAELLVKRLKCAQREKPEFVELIDQLLKDRDREAERDRDREAEREWAREQVK